MIGNWLATLTSEQGGRVLSTKMARCGVEAACLVMAVHPDRRIGSACTLPWRPPDGSYRYYGKHHLSIAGQYDALCFRFGDERINAAIRNRILRNQLRRTLTAPQLESVTV